MGSAVGGAARPAGSELRDRSLDVSNDFRPTSRVGRARSVPLDAFRAGEREALAAMYRNYLPVVSRYLRALTRRRGNMAGAQDAAVEDLAQEVFLRAFSAAARVGYDRAHDFVPFLLTIAKNRFRDLCRREGREEPWEQEKFHAHPGGETATQAAELPGASTELDAAVLLVLSSYVHALPEELRRVYDLRFAKEESQESAAKALGLSRAQLRTREKRIKTGLRIAIRSAGIDLASSSSRRSPKSTAPPPPRRK